MVYKLLLVGICLGSLQFCTHVTNESCSPVSTINSFIDSIKTQKHVTEEIKTQFFDKRNKRGFLQLPMQSQRACSILEYLINNADSLDVVSISEFNTMIESNYVNNTSQVDDIYIISEKSNLELNSLVFVGINENCKIYGIAPKLKGENIVEWYVW